VTGCRPHTECGTLAPVGAAHEGRTISGRSRSNQPIHSKTVFKQFEQEGIYQNNTLIKMKIFISISISRFTAFLNIVAPLLQKMERKRAA
jgi:hypothetical protein